MSLTQVTTGGVDENINIDSNTLKVDGTNNRVGIGTAAPGGNLHVQGATGASGTIYLTDGDATGVGNSFLIGKSGTATTIKDRQSGSSLIFGTADTNRLWLNSAGNLGVGTSSPQRLLDLKPSTNSSALQLTQSNANDGWRFHSDGPNGGNLHINRWASGTETTRLTILNDGSVGIGTSPSQKLHVTGQALFNNGSNFYVNSASAATVLDAKSGVLRFDMNGTESMRISSGNLGIGQVNPSYKLDLYRTGSGVVGRFGKDTIFGELHVAGNDVSFQGTRSSDSAVTGFFVRNPTNTGTSNFDHVTIKTTGSERLRVDNLGRLGINCIPFAQFHVRTGTNANITMTTMSSEAAIETFNDAGNANVPFRLRASEHKFFIGGTERMQITSSGEIRTRNGGFFSGTNNGDAPYANAPIVLQNTANNTNATVIQFKGWNSTQSGSISTRVNVTTYSTSSDYRLKENVVAIADGITRIKQLAPKRFNFIGYADTTCDGFLAHEAQAVVPEAVVGTHDEVDGDGNAVMQSIDQSKLVPLLTAALQEAITKIETLEAKVAALEAAA